MASIRENRSNGRETTWSVLYRHGINPKTGKPKQTSETFSMRKAPRGSGLIAAEEFKALVESIGPEKAVHALRASRGQGDESTPVLTVDGLFDKWIDWKATTGVTDRTVKDYRRDYVNWIREALGDRPADSIDELDVQAWVDQMTKRGLDPKSVRDRHAMFGGMYRFGKARSRRLVEHDPTTETQLPDKERTAPKGFTLAQWEAMHAWAVEHEPEAADLMLFFASTGWRWGETAPLTPAGVEDRGDVVLEVKGQRIQIPDVHVAVLGVNRVDQHDRVVFVEGKAKSRASMRQINLPPAAAMMVRRRMVGIGLNDPLFTNRRGKMWHAQNFIQREFQRTLDAVGIEKVKGMGPHYFRHTHVAMMNRAGIAAGTMSRRIGHDDISTTFNVYGGGIDNALSPAELVQLGGLIAHDEGITVVGEAIDGQIVRGAIG